jgi:hypothetical protein
MQLGLKPDHHACDVISVVAEFMVDVAGMEARPPCVQPGLLICVQPGLLICVSGVRFVDNHRD